MIFHLTSKRVLCRPKQTSHWLAELVWFWDIFWFKQRKKKQKTIDSFCHLHCCMTSRRVEDPVPLLRGQLAITILVCLREHLPDLGNIIFQQLAKMVHHSPTRHCFIVETIIKWINYFKFKNHNDDRGRGGTDYTNSFKICQINTNNCALIASNNRNFYSHKRKYQFKKHKRFFYGISINEWSHNLVFAPTWGCSGISIDHITKLQTSNVTINLRLGRFTKVFFTV